MNKQLKKTMDQLTPKRLKKTLETQHSSGSESSFGTDDKIREIPKKAATQLDEFFEQDVSFAQSTMLCTHILADDCRFRSALCSTPWGPE